MIEIIVNKISKNYGFNNVFKDISFDVKTNEKVALIGNNGCGKTTLLKIISNIENITSGTLSVRKESKIGYLTQTLSEDIIVKDYIYKNLMNVIEIKDRLKSFEEEMSLVSGKKLESLINKYTRLQDEFINLDGYEVEAKIAKTINAFKIDNELLSRNFNSLSGGEKTIISLASLILGNFDILLLDEPTNHLDIEAIEWLEDYLKNYKGTIILVSHDRYFLDKVINKTILIEKNGASIFNGNYSYFLEENEKRIMLEFKNFTNQEKQIEKMKEAIRRLREFGRLAAPEGGMFFRRAASIEKRLEKIELLLKPRDKKTIPLNFDIDKRTGVNVLEVKDINIKFDKEILNNASMNISFKERVCLIGPNGSGKSSLIKSILNNDSSIRIGSNVLIGYIPQIIEFEDENIRLIDEARKYFNNYEQYLRSSLYKFMFEEDNIYKKLNVLSGGERVRLKLFCLIQEKANFLILDEPTNHIDIDTREVLENALEDYEGTLLFVSHDRYFINKVATRIISIENKSLVSYLGNYDYYREKAK